MLAMLMFLLFGADIKFEGANKEKVTLTNFNDFGIIDKVVKLESTEESLIGQISRVSYDDSTNTVYIADINSTHAIFAFTIDGDFIKKVATVGNGPTDIKGNICDMAMLESGLLLVLSRDFISYFDQNGDFIKAVPLAPNRGYEMAASKTEVFIESLNFFKYNGADSYKGSRPNRVSKYSEQGDLLKRFGNDDSRRAAYAFLPHETTQVFNNEVWVLDLYEPIIRIYDTSGNLIRRFIFKQWNKETLDELWASKLFTEQTRTNIKKNMHRFDLMLPFGDRMLVFDTVTVPKFNMNMYTFHKDNSIKYYSGYNPLNPEYEKKTLVFKWLVGHYNNGIIATIEPEASFKENENKFTLLKNVHLKDEDNPLLVFIKPK